MSTNRPEVKARALALLFAAMFVASAAHAAVPAKLKEALSASSTKVRIIAVASVAKSGDPEARGLLERMLKDPEATVRGAAVDGLATLKDPGALAALEAIKNDPDVGVRAIAGRAITALEALVVNVDIGDAEDLSGGSIPGLLPLLQSGVEKELKAALPGFSIQRGGVGKGYGLLLKIRSIKKSKQDGNGIIEIKTDMTLVELPGKILRLTSSATAAAGVDGDIPKAMEKELATDAINACAPSLAKDFIEYAQQRIQRK
ncbi:MAG: HEAT repeat domain-containing protein [Deltaproteobacteria bacterium]|nr:HEAT repeat domain-containing protein [Deltaproteobacteria bacterium]